MQSWKKGTKRQNVIAGSVEEMFMELNNDIRRLERKYITIFRVRLTYVGLFL